MKKKSILLAAIVTLFALIMICSIRSDGTIVQKKSLLAEKHDSLDIKIKIDSLSIDVAFLLNEKPKLKLVSTDTVAHSKRYGTGGMFTFAQDGDKEMRVDLMARTDLIEDFMARFNGDSSVISKFNDVLDFTADGELLPREGLILTLTNCAEAHKDSTLRRFAQDMVKQELKIDNRNGSNYVPVVTLAYTNGSDSIFPVRLTLQQSVVNEAPVWYIVQVDSPYLTFGNKDKPFYIDIQEREFGFMGLSQHIDRAEFSVAGPDFKGDTLSAYLLLVSKGLIHYLYSEKTQFVFRLGEYQFLVEHIESFEHYRSGYLITRIIKGKKLVFENRQY